MCIQEVFLSELLGCVWRRSAPLVEVDLSLLAANVREATADTLDRGEGEHDLDLTIKVGVQHTQDVLKVGLVHDERPGNGEGSGG